MASTFALFRSPAQINFGSGSAETAGAEAARLGGTHAMLISDPAILKLGIAGQVSGYLQAAGIQVTVWSDVQAEPPVESLDACLEAARAASCDLVVGLGGGSALDTAKAVAMLLGNGGNAEDYFGIGLVKRRGVPSILMPTTSGTGSEVTPNALFYVQAARDKKAIVSPHIIPDVAIVDPLLTLTVPPSVTAWTGVDALCHAVESYTSVNANPLTEPYGLESIRLVGASLRTAVGNGKNVAAREAMAAASLLAAMSMGTAGTNAVHALAYPLQGQHRIPHGVANSVLLPYVMEFNAASDLHKFARVAEALGMSTAGMSIREAALSSAEACRQLSQDVGIPSSLTELGIRGEHLDDLVEGAMKVTRLLANNPRQVRAEDARAMFQRAL